MRAFAQINTQPCVAEVREGNAMTPPIRSLRPVPDKPDSLSRIADACQSLTHRECDVLDRLASGETDRQIAARLGVSPRTVHKHLEHVYRKLGVATRTAAVVRLIGVDRRGG